MDAPLLPSRQIARKRREDLGISYERLAERLSMLCGFEVKWQSIQQFEQGKSQHPRFIRELAKALTTTDEFLSGRTSDPKLHDSAAMSRYTSDRPKRGLAGQEGNLQSDLWQLNRLIGRLEQRLEALEKKVTDLESGTVTHPQRGTKTRA